MALTIRHREAERLARELAAATGETVTGAVLKALRHSLAREQGKVVAERLLDELKAIRKRCAALPVLDNRSPEELIGYDDHGLPR